MARILLAGHHWQARALLRAQLIEEGLDVEAHETIREALKSLEASPALPTLFVADLTFSDDPASDAQLLSAWSMRVPIWILASRSLIVQEFLKGHGFEMTFFRPIDLGELVEQIKQRLMER